MTASQITNPTLLLRFRNMLDEGGALPLYHQVKQVLMDLIESGELAPGSEFFSEEEIAEALAVSRPTVGRAMRELIAEGNICRERGKRAYVRTSQSVPLVFMGELISFGEMLQRIEKPYRTALISREVLPTTMELRKALRTAEQEVIYLRRLRFVDDTPILFVNSYLPRSRFGALMDIDPSVFDTDLYSLLQKQFGVRVRHAEREVMAVRSGIDETKLLGIPLWAPCLRLSGTSFDENDQPVERFISYLKGSLGVLRSDILRPPAKPV
ncbi:GntR family transcriptional regulator [Candidatus Bipolaricaulota bacterium]|nr:GntR family transcriptional regulator [Candidatus Bipolaricaulota bacterium]